MQQQRGRGASRQVVFVHPDLGIGGAERLVVDAALAAKAAGHRVVVVTSHHPKEDGKSFVETRDGTLDVRVRGDWLPRHVCGKGHVLFAILRSLYASACIVMEGVDADVFFVDQVSACVPVLRWCAGGRVLFYCHHPDLLLTDRRGWLKKLYRMPMDWFEQVTTGYSDVVVVNSQYTKSVYDATFTAIKDRLVPDVLYPSINLSNYDKDYGPCEVSPDDCRKHMLLSINRFERKKDIGLAIRALAFIKQHGLLDEVKESMDDVQLVIAGGYDVRVAENVEHYKELNQAAHDSGLSTSDFPNMDGDVVFLRSFTEAQRSMLLSACRCVVYTPSNEHFGIVPIEAMYARRPVIAVNNGGPLESVKNGQTGLLCEATDEAFARAMVQVIGHPKAAREMGEAGRQHVIDRFSLQAFSRQLDDSIVRLAAHGRRRPTGLYVVLAIIFAVLGLLIVLTK